MTFLYFVYMNSIYINTIDIRPAAAAGLMSTDTLRSGSRDTLRSSSLERCHPQSKRYLFTALEGQYLPRLGGRRHFKRQQLQDRAYFCDLGGIG